MRILILSDQIPPENRGGAGIVTWRLASQLQKCGHDVHVIASTQAQSFREIREGIPTYHIHVNYPLRLRAWFSLYNPRVNQPLRELYQEIQPDVINSHNIHTYLTYHSLQIAHKMGIPTVFSSHDVMPFTYQKMAYFDRTSCRVDPATYRLPTFFNLRQMRLRYNPFRNMTIRRILSDHTQVRTAPSQELCSAHHANHLPEFRCVHNGIDVEEFTPSQETIHNVRHRLNLQDRQVILFAGRLTGAKGTKQLLDAMKILVKQHPDVTLLVLSSVAIKEQVQDSNYANLLDRHVIAGGWLEGDDLSAAFHVSDIVVVPSIIFDTFPTVNLEAMASHTVAIASCFGGSHEAIVDNETGFVINPFDTDNFAEKLINLLSDDEKRHAMAERAFSRVREKFTLTIQAQQMLDCYQKAIETA